MIEIKGKTKIILIPLPKDADEFKIIHHGTRVAYFQPTYKRFDIPKNKCTIIGKLSEITEEQCYDLVEGFGLSNGWRNYLVESQYMECLTKTAKESLETLIVSNDVYLKEWRLEPNPKEFYSLGMFDAIDKFDEAIKDYEKAPEDFLILTVREDDVCKEEIG
jgi:hypothetical protein